MMRNLKKMAALGAAAVMALSMNVSAFASVAGSATASYTDGKVILNSLADIDATHQWTVVVISLADQNENLTADKLYYINQGNSGDTFWTDGMGTKTELTDGDYIVRIGGETIDTVDKLIEIPLKVSASGGTKIITFYMGDVTGDNVANTTDAAKIVSSLVGGSLAAGGDYNINDVIGEAVINGENVTFVCGDVTGDGVSNTTDAAKIVSSLVGGSLSAGAAYDINAKVELEVPIN